MQSKKKSLYRIFAMFMVIMALSCIAAIPASADYYLTDDDLYLQYMPEAYTVKQVVTAVQENKLRYVLNSPEDLYIDGQDNVYVVDTGNNRVIKLNSQMEFVQSYPAVDAGDKAQLKSPKGIYVDKDGDLYIADTENGRIVHLNPQGHFVEDFDQPTEETFDKETAYKPSKVYVDDYGILYIINDKDEHGIITINAEGSFLGYIGAPKIGFNPVTYFLRIFASKDQLEQLAKETPPFYSNISINGDGTIYATSMYEESNQIKRLTPSGSNVYPPKFYAEKNNQNKTTNGLPSLEDIAVNKDGMVFTIDSTLDMVYIYDQSGKSVVVFGGKGSRQLMFQSPSALSITSKNEILVLDKVLGTIQVLQPTAFMQNVFKAVTYYNSGEYEAAIQPWKNVLNMDSNYKLAQVGIAKAMLRNGDSQDALKLYTRAIDQPGYSEAFEQLRADFFKSRFLLVAFLAIASLAVLYFAVKVMKKYADRIADRPVPLHDRAGVRFFLETGACILFHPIDTFYKIKVNRRKLYFWPIALMLFILVAEKILFRQIIHFPLSDSVVYIDYFRDLVVFFLPLVSFIMVSFAITSISDGKQTFKETATCTLYSFIPFILFYLPITAFSRILCSNEKGLYMGMQTVLFVWCLLLIFLNFKILNEYSFKKAVFSMFKVLFAMLCFWVVCFLFYIVIVQLLVFVKDIYTEFTYLLKQG